MKKRILGTSGIEASAIGLGTWAIGGFLWGGTDEDASIAAIRASLDSGVTLVDTAPVYGFGQSEDLVGRAIEGRRDEVVLATKCGLVWHVEKGILQIDGDPKVYRYLHPDSIRYEIEQSLRRLRTDRIDLYQTHWQDETTPIDDTMAALLELKDAGKIRAIGASNAAPDPLNAYRAAGPLDVVQDQFSMLDRTHEADLLPYCREHGLAFLAYSSLALGLLTGKIRPGHAFKGDDIRKKTGFFIEENLKRVCALTDALSEIAAGYSCTVGQLALAWTLAQPGVSHALVGARNPEQAVDNARGGEIDPSESDLMRIEELIGKHVAGLPRPLPI